MRPSQIRADVRHRVADLVHAGAALGLAGRDLARYVERARPLDATPWMRRVWQQERLKRAGRLRRVRADAPAEYAGMLGLTGGGD